MAAFSWVLTWWKEGSRPLLEQPWEGSTLTTESAPEGPTFQHVNGGGAHVFSALHGVTFPTSIDFQNFLSLNPKMGIRTVSLLLRAK